MTIVAVLSLLGAGLAHAEAPGTSEAFTLETRVRVGNSGESLMRYARVTMPLLHAVTLYGGIVEEHFSHQVQEILELEDGGRLGVFLVETLRPGQEQHVTVTYLIDPALRESLPWAGSGESESQQPHLEILRQARTVTWMLSSQDAKINRLMEFTKNHIRYDLNSAHRNSDALVALRTGEGVCEDYANLFVALASAIGIESRVVFGYRYSPVRSVWERHAWVEFVDEAGQWIAADPTFHSRPGLNPQARYVAQWHEDRPIRIAYVGGRLSAGYSEGVSTTPYQAAAR